MNNINVKENIKVKIVSLKNSDRRDNFIDLPINYSFFDAVENNHLDTFNVKKSEEKYQREIRNGEIGCSLSHYQLYKDLSKSHAEYYLILEDDAVLLDSGKLLDLYYDLLNKKFSKPTILILGHSKVAVEDFKWQKLKQPLFDKFNLAGSKFGYKNVNTCGTVSYFINKKAAEKIVRNEMVYWLADDWNELSSFGIDVFHIENPIIKEDLQFSSSTGNDVFSYHSFIKHPIKSIFQIFYYRILYILGIRKWL